jgi:hypothetical protein
MALDNRRNRRICQQAVLANDNQSEVLHSAWLELRDRGELQRKIDTDKLLIPIDRLDRLFQRRLEGARMACGRTDVDAKVARCLSAGAVKAAAPLFRGARASSLGGCLAWPSLMLSASL